jgi:hypothetical protein
MAVSTLSDMWESNFRLIGDLKDKALAAMNRLEELARSSTTAIYHGPIQINDIPELRSIDISTLPTVAEIMGSISDITIDPFPEAPGDMAQYKRHVWADSTLGTLSTALMAYVNSMGIPDQTFQDAIFDADKERKTRALSDALDVIAAQTSGRGFKYANIQTNAATLELMEKYQYDLENQSREITKLVTEWARQNFQFGIQQGIAIENLQMDFAIKYADLIIRQYEALLRAVLEKYRAQVAAELEVLRSKLEAIKALIDAMKAQSEITVDEQRLRLEKANIQVTEALGRFRGAIEDFGNNTMRQIQAAAHFAGTAAGIVQASTNSVLGVMTTKTA